MSCHVGCSSEGKLKHGAEHPKMSSKGALANIRPSNCNRVLAPPDELRTATPVVTEV
jgi:hypothetical protein